MNRNNLSNAFAELQTRGHRLTRPRRRILERLYAERSAVTAYELHRQVGASDVSLASVYRTLEILVDLHLAETVAHPGAEQQYLACSLEHHHHLICDGCGTVAELDECVIAPLESQVERQSGFKIEGHTLEFHGRCSTCQS